MHSGNPGKQTISCTVRSCSYNDNAYCSLQSIQVAPNLNCGNGKPEDESMCASYESRG
jgi:hypothetical protein